MRLLCAGALLALAAPAAAVELSHFPIDVADPEPGRDRWQVLYQLDSFPYAQGYGFTVYFDPTLYAELESDPAPHPHWDAITSEPDPNLGADGFLDVETVVDTPSTAAVFAVSFDWLGAGTPGAQPFEVREPAPGYATVESGTTVLPEPGALALSAGSALALGALRTARRTRC
ncbi:MAG: hypothetical protein DCC71_16545 [Proteobacteria bacterium]|nr:MAG: hypothetical protein DCC71_16545 [Pseudomonadota bacterium]